MSEGAHLPTRNQAPDWIMDRVELEFAKEKPLRRARGIRHSRIARGRRAALIEAGAEDRDPHRA